MPEGLEDKPELTMFAQDMPVLGPDQGRVVTSLDDPNRAIGERRSVEWKILISI